MCLMSLFYALRKLVYVIIYKTKEKMDITNLWIYLISLCGVIMLDFISLGHSKLRF